MLKLFRHKIVVSAIAACTVVAIVVTTVLNTNVQSTYAQESFPGLKEIIDSKSFKILEIVPDMSMAKLGLLVNGEESYYDPVTGTDGSLEDVLAGMTAKSQRTAYVNSTLKDIFQDLISGSGSQAVLSYTEYKESYTSEEDYDKSFQLSSKQILDSQSDELAGYTMTDLGEGGNSGHYSLESKYVAATDTTEPSVQRYSENISYFCLTSDERYYNVEFSLLSDGELSDAISNHEVVYTSISGEPISEERWKELQEGTLFYKWNAADDSFTLCQKIAEAQPEQKEDVTPGNGTESSDPASLENGVKQISEWTDQFYMVYFQYVDASNVTDDGSYYQVSDVTFCADGNGTYGSVLDKANPYLPDPAGNFIKDDEHMYYVKSDNGGQRYELAKADDSVHPDYDVEINTVYYTGGFSSNDTLKEDVFNQSLLLDENSALKITVSAVTANEVTVQLVDEYDLIYLSDSSVYNLNNDPSEYTEDDDLSGPVANEIYHLAVNTDSASAVYKPVIVDAGILNSGNVSQDTNIYKLAKLLLGADLDGDNASYDEDSDTWNISEEEYQAFADADGDGYFVHCNIFSVPADGAQVGTGNGTFSLLEDLAVPFVEVNEASRSEYENFSSESEDSFDAQASKLGFREVSANICLENFVRESENISKSDDSQKYKFFNLSISKAICMEYIICYASKRETSETDIIKVLDIEPCTISSVDKVDNTGNIISESTQTQIENQVKELLGIKDDGIDDDQQISFTHMTSAELIGKVEDLCKYDLIYMGLCTDSMNITKVTHYYLKSDTAHEKPVDISSVKGDWTKNYDKVEETVTNYNDSKMKGLVYSNIGDLKKAKCFAGVLDTDYNYNYYYGAYGRYFKQANNIWYTGNGINESSYSTTRYSGNDLTKEKLNDLIDYVKSAAPVILADDFLVVQSDGTKKVNDIRTVYKEVKAANGTITLEAEDENTENGLIDNCSRMYELIDEIAASKTYKNVKTCTEWESNQTLLNQYITLGKPKLEVTEQAKVTDEEYVQIDGDTIAIDFSVKTYASTDTKTPFNVDLFIDFNADGRYSKTTEKIDVNAYNIYLVDDEKNTKELQNVTSMEEDGVVSECHSVAPLNGESDSVHYRLEYSVSKDYLGVYPVKLVVEQQDNLYRYAYWQGYFYHSKTSGSATQDVYVLQILPSSVTVSNYYNCALFDMDLTGKYSDGAASDDAVYSGYYKDKYKTHNAESYYTFADVDTSLNKELYTQDYWDGKGENLSADQLNERRWNMLTDTFEHSTFYKYIYGTVEEGCKLSGYTMHIDSIFGDTLVDKFTNADGSFNQTGYQSYLDHFDMLVLGFGDSVTYFGEDTIAGLVDNYYVGIHNYIESGKSVLFTHDTTSYNASTWMSNEYKNTWENGHMSDLLAGDVGFDRYGVYNNDDSLLSLALSVGIDDLTEGDEEKIKVSEYPSLVSAMKKIEESASLQDTYLLKGTETEITKGKLYDIIVGEAASENKDIAYEPNSGKKTLTYEVQGRSTIALNKDGSSISGYNLINLVHDKSIFNDNKTVVQQWGVARTTSAELLNEGQILVYPYNILDQLDENGIMQIAKTHYQYFQIDMNADDDNDGESDITVWLSLTDSIDNTIEYDTAKRDARNNYYIYTKGNVTYSGVGHSRINTIGNDVEVQLYINTIIASYQASSQKPEVSFKESADLGSADMDTIYVSLDSTISVDDSTSIGTVIEGVNSLDDVTAPSEYKTVDGDDGKAYYWKADANMKNGVVDSDSYEAAYIYVQDTNTVRGTEKDITLSYYLIVDSPSDVPEKLSKLGLSVVNLKTLMKESEDVYAIPLDLQTYTMLYDKNGTLAPQSFDELNDTAVSGKTYRVDIPYYLLAEDQKRVEIRCYATTTIKKEDAVISTLRNCDSIYLQRISLFDLD